MTVEAYRGTHLGTVRLQVSVEAPGGAGRPEQNVHHRRRPRHHSPGTQRQRLPGRAVPRRSARLCRPVGDGAADWQRGLRRAASPANALDEVNAICALLGARIGDRDVLSELSAVRRPILDPRPCRHPALRLPHQFSDEAGSASPSTAAHGRQPISLRPCRRRHWSRAARWYSSMPAARRVRAHGSREMSGCGNKVLRGRAGASIGSLWSVRSSPAPHGHSPRLSTSSSSTKDNRWARHRCAPARRSSRTVRPDLAGPQRLRQAR